MLPFSLSTKTDSALLNQVRFAKHCHGRCNMMSGFMVFPAFLTFTTIDWEVKKTVWVYAINGAFAEDKTTTSLRRKTQGLDVACHQLQSELTLTIHDDDQVGVVLFGRYLRLQSRPHNRVLIRGNSFEPVEINPESWNSLTPIKLLGTSTDKAVTVSSSDAAYNLHLLKTLGTPGIA